MKRKDSGPRRPHFVDETPAPLSANAFHTLLALHAGPLHGYAIMLRVRETSGRAIGPGAVYGTLRRLEDGGMVREGLRQESERGPKERQQYKITPRGSAALAGEGRRLEGLARLVADLDLGDGAARKR